jgi:predicted transcriptional regulator
MSLKDIIKTRSIIKIQPDENLSSALAKLYTSHDAAFVFSPENKYMGVINPYYCIIRSSFPGNAKVEHCIFHAPKIHENDSLNRVASQFIQSKIHYLPVFDRDDHFRGIISARHILAHFHALPIFQSSIQEALKQKRKSLIVIYEDETVAKAINLFKSSKLSKLVVIGKDMKLKGILSYYDLIAYLVMPKNSPEKTSFYNQKVKLFSKSFVITMSSDRHLTEVIRLILEKKIGSIVVVDKSKHPVGIITTKDLLMFFINQQQIRRIKLGRQFIGGFFNAFKKQ